jgi:ABC-type polysaccharide/polyol phosphate export permease
MSVEDTSVVSDRLESLLTVKMIRESFASQKKVFFSQRQIWHYLSQQDIKSRFRRSRIGIFWLVLHHLAFSLGGGLLWATVFGLNPSEFIPFLTVGFAVWGFIAATLTEGCGTFLIAHGYLKQLPLNQNIFIFRGSYTQLYYLFLAMMIAMVLTIVFGTFTIWGAVCIIPGGILLIVYGYAVIGLMSYLGIRYRDMAHAINGVLPLMFVLTPVIYPPEILIQKGLGFAVYFNPLASIIDIVRTPLVHGEFADFYAYCVVAFLTLCAFLARIGFESRWKNKIAYWV